MIRFQFTMTQLAENYCFKYIFSVSEKPQGKNHLGDQGTDGRILKWILKK